MNFRLFWLALFIAIDFVTANMRYDVSSFVQEGMQHDPMLAETRYSVEAKKIKSDALFAEAILPKLTFSMMVGPAPGLKESVDAWGDTVDTWDFTKMGPYFGTELQAVQPLNLGQYRVGQKAIAADVKQQEMNIAGEELKKEVELQSYYYNYLLALEILRIVRDAEKMVNKAYDKLEEALDNDDESVSQMDLLKMKANMHTIKEGTADAESGMRQVMLAVRFSLGITPADSFFTVDTTLTPRQEKFPALEDVQSLTLSYHPDLKRLEYGLAAKSYQMDLARAKLSPEFFIMGQFEYVKSWVGNRNALQKNAFAQDAVNKISGMVGIGLRYRLNFWSGLENYRMSKIEYRSLKMKEEYACNGIVLKAEEQYYKTLALKEKMDALSESRRAAEAILKGAAMQYDLDNSKTSELISAYTQAVNLQKDYYMAVCKYNIALAELIAKMGMHLEEYRNYK